MLVHSQTVLTVSVAIDTDLWRQMPREMVEQVFSVMPPKSKVQGASTPLVAALDPSLTGKREPSSACNYPFYRSLPLVGNIQLTQKFFYRRFRCLLE